MFSPQKKKLLNIYYQLHKSLKSWNAHPVWVYLHIMWVNYSTFNNKIIRQLMLYFGSRKYHIFWIRNITAWVT